MRVIGKGGMSFRAGPGLILSDRVEKFVLILVLFLVLSEKRR
jgi:hypothetical protein